MVKLDAASGTERWRRQRDGSGLETSDSGLDDLAGIATDGAGNVTIVGTLVEDSVGRVLLAAALDGATGRDLWRRQQAGRTSARNMTLGLALEPPAVGVVGFVADSYGGTDGLVWLLAGDGQEIWRREESAHLPDDARGVWLEESALAVAQDVTGNVVAAGRDAHGLNGRRLALRKDEGHSGTLSWEEKFLVASVPVFYRRDATVLVDARGDVVAAGDSFGYVFVAKFVGESGSLLWRYQDDPLSASFRDAKPVGIDAAGDVFLAGHRYQFMIVTKIRGTTGEALWSTVVPASFSASLVVDSAGDVIVLAIPRDSRFEMLLVKLDGATGAERWRYSSALQYPGALVVDAGGNLFVPVRGEQAPGIDGYFVLKIAGATGQELWRTFTGGTYPAPLLDTDPQGNVLATHVTLTYLPDEVVVSSSTATKLGGARGDVLWQRSLDAAGESVAAVASSADRDGNLVVAAEASDPPGLVVKLAADDGRILWTRALAEGGEDAEVEIGGIALDPAGDVAVGGGVRVGGGGLQFMVARFDGRTGGDLDGPDDPRCVAELAAAGDAAFLGRLRRLRRCRNRMARGLIAIPPETCADHLPTQQDIARGMTKLRETIARSCTLLPRLACAATLDGLITSDGGAGCLATAHRIAADQVMTAGYGPLPGARNRSALRCELAIGTAAYRLARATMHAARGLSPRTVERVAGRIRHRLAQGCSDPLPATVTPCATTLAQLIAPDGDGGCLIAAVRAAAARLRAVHGG